MDTNTILLQPPVAFAILLSAVVLIAVALKALAIVPAHLPSGLAKSYACGEDLKDHMIQPDYGQFFPFAFFFTILHVAALMCTTVPTDTAPTFLVALTYFVGAVVALFVLYRR